MIYQLKKSYTTASSGTTTVSSGTTTGATAIGLGQKLFLGLIFWSGFTVVGFEFGF